MNARGGDVGDGVAGEGDVFWMSDEERRGEVHASGEEGEASDKGDGFVEEDVVDEGEDAAAEAEEGEEKTDETSVHVLILEGGVVGAEGGGERRGTAGAVDVSAERREAVTSGEPSGDGAREGREARELEGGAEGEGGARTEPVEEDPAEHREERAEVRGAAHEVHLLLRQIELALERGRVHREEVQRAAAEHHQLAQHQSEPLRGVPASRRRHRAEHPTRTTRDAGVPSAPAIVAISTRATRARK